MPASSAPERRDPRRDRAHAREDREHLVRLGRVIEQVRKRHHLTQAELGEAAAVKRHTIGAIEDGQGNPHFSTMLRLCRVLKLPGWILFPPPPGTVLPALLPLLAQLTEQEQRAVLAVLDIQVTPASYLCGPE